MMQNNTQLPYANLYPSLILEAIDNIGFHCTGSLSALNSYENRVYQVGLEDGSYVIAKFYRPHRWSDETILEEHQFALELTEHEIPIVAPIRTNKASLHYYQDFRFAIFPRWGGRALELDSLAHLAWMGRFIGRLHAVGACRPFHHRPTLTTQTHGAKAYQYLLTHHFVPAYLRTKYSQIVEQALHHINRIYQSIDNLVSIRLHGDLHAGNILWDDRGPHIVDLDDCLMGPAIQDIWMLLSGDTAQISLQLDTILESYQEFYDFNPQEIKLIEPLRTLRMLNYAAWLAKRWHDPAFPLNFPWFNTEKYWEEHIRHLSEQMELLAQVA